MIISFQRKFIFIHTHKAAGTSIKAAYIPMQLEEDIIYGGTKANEKLSSEMRALGNPWKHSTALEVKTKLGKLWDKFFTFSFVRNPWDRCVSNYFWWMKTTYRDTWQTHEKVKALKDFNEYIDGDFVTKMPKYSDALCDDDGIILDFVGRYERLEDDFSSVCKTVGIPKINLPHENATSHKHYTEYYSEDSKAKVYEIFADDINRFSYKFGD